MILALWLRIGNNQSDQQLVNAYGDNGTIFWKLSVKGELLQLTFYPLDYPPDIISIKLLQNIWFYYVLYTDGLVSKAYINGKLVKEQNTKNAFNVSYYTSKFILELGNLVKSIDADFDELKLWYSEMWNNSSLNNVNQPYLGKFLKFPPSIFYDLQVTTSIKSSCKLGTTGKGCPVGKNIMKANDEKVTEIIYSSTDNFLSPILVFDWLILYCGNLILQQK